MTRLHRRRWNGMVRSNFHVTLPVLPKPKTPKAPQLQEGPLSGGKTVPIRNTTSQKDTTPEGTSAPKDCRVEAHETHETTVTSKAAPQPDHPVKEEDIENTTSAVQTDSEIPTTPSDQAQHRPAGCENQSNGANTGRRCEDATNPPSIREGGPVRKGRHVAWSNGGDQWPGDDEDEDGDEEKWQPPTSRTIDQHARKFACPFYKKYSDCNDLPKACRKGWPSVPRLKEHIARCHLRNTVDCTRCFVSFKTQRELNEHLRSQTRCEINSPCPLKDRMYITQAQERAVKKRKKNVPGEEKWLDLFRIIFPDASVGNQLPNPCESIGILWANPDRNLIINTDYEPPRDVSRETALLDDFCALLMEDIPPLLEVHCHNVSFTNSVGSLRSFRQILATKVPELKEAFLAQLASPASNRDSPQGLGSQVPPVNNSTSIPHHPRRITSPAHLRQDGPVPSFPLHAFLSLPGDRFSGSFTDFLLEENSNATVSDPMFNEEPQSEQPEIHFQQTTNSTCAGEASSTVFQTDIWTAGMELGQPGSITLPDHTEEELLL
ncbi:hypothetical protein QBC39DRAFT_18453 [Podospora conica]|nr:hypothetical protein QBC39DRAFT_18453 [Schizothecium conicum]